MSIDTLIANREAIPETIRQAGYPSLATQTENDMDELVGLQTGDLKVCQRQLDEARGNLSWLVHLHHDVGKSGGRPDDDEWKDALDAAMAILDEAGVE